VTEKVAAEILSLPMYPELEHSRQKAIVQEVINSLAREALASRKPKPVAATKRHAADDFRLRTDT